MQELVEYNPPQISRQMEMDTGSNCELVLNTIQSNAHHYTIQIISHKTKFCNRIKSFQVDYSTRTKQCNKLQFDLVLNTMREPLGKLTVEPISSIYIKIICIPKTQPLYIKTIFILYHQPQVNLFPSFDPRPISPIVADEQYWILRPTVDNWS